MHEGNSSYWIRFMSYGVGLQLFNWASDHYVTAWPQPSGRCPVAQLILIGCRNLKLSMDYSVSWSEGNIVSLVSDIVQLTSTMSRDPVTEFVTDKYRQGVKQVPVRPLKRIIQPGVSSMRAKFMFICQNICSSIKTAKISCDDAVHVCHSWNS